MKVTQGHMVEHTSTKQSNIGIVQAHPNLIMMVSLGDANEVSAESLTIISFYLMIAIQSADEAWHQQ